MLPASPDLSHPVATTPTLPAFSAQDSVNVNRATYVWEGAAIGAGVLGLATAWLVGGFCGYNDARQDCTGAYLGGGFVGAFIGGIIGGMIGGNVQKSRQPGVS